jgi:transcriptional regulator with XRE-family HTH domain
MEMLGSEKPAMLIWASEVTEVAYRTPVEVGAVVADLRRAAGLDQGQVAAHLGIDQPAVSRIERGERRLNAWELYALAELLAVEPGRILGREEPGAALLRVAGAGEGGVREALATFEMVVREVLGARALEELL